MAKDQLGLALTVMLDIVQESEARKELILFSSQHSHLRREERHMQSVDTERSKLNMNFLDFLESTIPLLPEPIDEGPLLQITQQQDRRDHYAAAPQSAHAAMGTQGGTLSKSVIGSGGFVAGKTPLSRLPYPSSWAKPAERDSLDRWAQAIGRESEVNEILNCLQPGHALALYGMGGTGKSTLASIIAQQQGGTYPGGVLWAELGHEFRGADAVPPLLNHWASYHVGGPGQAYQIQDWAEWVFEGSAIREIIGGHGPILLILDDLWDIQVWEKIRPALPAEAAVLVTTRDARIARSIGSSYEVSGMGQDDALKLLQQFAPEIDASILLELAEALNFHVQALQIAGSDLRSRPDYQREEALRTLIQQVKAGTSMGDLHELDGVPHEPAVAASLQISYDDIGKRMGPAYQEAIRSLGIMGTEESILIPQMAAALWNLPEKETNLFLEVLTARSLIQTSETPGIYRQHALVRSFSRSLLKKHTEELTVWRRYRDFLLGWLEAVGDLEVEDYTSIELLRPHIFKLGDTLAEGVRTGDEEAAVSMVDFVGNIWTYLLRRPALGALAEKWLKSGLDAARKLEQKIPETIFLNALGNWELGLGRMEPAKQYYHQALALVETVPDNPVSMALVKQNLGVLYMNEGKPLEAKTLFEHAIPLLEEAGDPHNQAMAMQNLGTVLLNLGDFKESVKRYEEVIPKLQALKHSYGEGLALANLGKAHIGLSQIPKALEIFEKALPILQQTENLYGESIVLQNRGLLFMNQTKVREAFEDLEVALDGFKAIGHEPEVRNTLIILANLYLRNGRFEQAQPVMEELYAIRSKDPDAFDASIASNPGTLSMMASIMTLTGNTDKAIGMFERACIIYEAWGNKPSLAETRYQQGDACIRVGKPKEAEPYLNAAKILYTALNYAPGLALAHNSLGLSKLHQEQYQESYDYFKKALPEMEKMPFGDSATMILSQNNLGLALSGLGRTSEALESLNSALAYAEKAENPAMHALVMNNVGIVNFKAGNKEEAIKCAQKSIAIMEDNRLAIDAGGQPLDLHKQVLGHILDS